MIAASEEFMRSL